MQRVKLKKLTFLLQTLPDSRIVVHSHCVIFTSSFTIRYIDGDVDIETVSASICLLTAPTQSLQN